MAQAFAKLPLFVAYYRRAYPRFVKLKQDLAAGRLGTIQSVSYVFARRPAPPRAGDWRLDAERSGGGKFVDIGSHALDLIDFLLGPLERVRASASGPAGQVETKVEMHFRVGKIDGTATWSFEASESEDLLVITGAEGSVRVPSAMNGRELVWADGVETYDPPDPVQLPLVTKVVDAILDGSECPSTATSSTRTSRAIDAALGHYYGGAATTFGSGPRRGMSKRYVLTPVIDGPSHVTTQPPVGDSNESSQLASASLSKAGWPVDRTRSPKMRPVTAQTAARFAKSASGIST